MDKRPYRTTVTVVGTAVSAIALLFILSFLFFELVSGKEQPYLGLFTFLILPGFLLLGLITTLVGFLQTRRQLKKLGGQRRPRDYYPRVDLSLASHRQVVSLMAVGVALFLPFIGVMSYKGYHYTDSNAFCGLVCHSVMEPQYAAYLQSPHARVQCVECHIGEGATWYVRSKLSGVRQVFATALNTYPRPIPPAIAELRPARETCEECHWPEKFFGDQLLTLQHFAADEKNTPRQVRMIVKTGGNDPTAGPPSGIHWHMVLGHSIEYVATDDRFREIPWARVTEHASGESTVYRSDGQPPATPPPAGIRRTLDCMDCHNLPTHIFRSPDEAADTALHVNPGLRSLPFAKRELVQAVVQPYASKEAGLNGVAEAIRSYYRDEHPDVHSEREATVGKLVEAGQRIYKSYFFPKMNVRWDTYPNDIGHLIFPGCFRCHQGQHVNGHGETIEHSCEVCHDFLEGKPEAGGHITVRIGGFHHSIELEGAHATMRCNRCHTGGIAPARTCPGCHVDQAGFLAGTLTGVPDLNLPADVMADLDCTDCHDLAEPRDIKTIGEACAGCHDEEYAEMLAAWDEEVRGLVEDVQGQGNPETQRRLSALRRAGPLHNMEASRSLLGTSSRSVQP